jgi:hypothetical protein
MPIVFANNLYHMLREHKLITIKFLIVKDGAGNGFCKVLSGS